MSLAGLLTVITDNPQVQRVLTGAAGGGGDLIAPSELRPFLAAALATTGVTAPEDGRFVLAVTATQREAEDLADALGSVLPPAQVACFPSWETLPHERLSPRSDTVGQRLAVLRRLTHPDPGDAVAG